MIFGYSRIKKRVLVVLALCLLALVLPVFLLYACTSRRVGSDNLADFALADVVSRQSIHGLGINLVNFNNGNLLDNNSFEPLAYRQNLLIDSGDQKTIKVAMPNDPKSGIYADDFFIGAKANVLTRDSQGNRLLKKTGTVNQYKSDQIDSFYKLPLPLDLPMPLKWQALAENGQTVIMGGEQGYILCFKSLSEVAVKRLPSKKDIVGAAGFDQCFMILDAEGNLYSLSEDGRFKLLVQTGKVGYGAEVKLGDLTRTKTPHTTNQALTWRGLAARLDQDGNWNFLAVADKGYYLYGDEEKCKLSRLTKPADINAITATEDGFYLVGQKSLAFYTNNGLNFRYLDLTQAGDWQAISSRGRQILICGKQGQLAFSPDGVIFKELNQTKLRSIFQSDQEERDKKDETRETIKLNPDFMACSILSNRQFILLDQQGRMYYSDDLGQDWLSGQQRFKTGDDTSELAEKPYNLIRRISSGQLIAAGNDGSIQYAMMGLTIELDSGLEQGKYQNGDLLQLEQLASGPAGQVMLDQEDGEWYVSDPGSVEVQFSESAPGGGHTALSIDLDRIADKGSDKLTGLYSAQTIQTDRIEDGFVLRQKLSKQVCPKINNNNFFVFDFWAKTDNPDELEMTLKMTNLNFNFEPVVKSVQGDWQKYQVFFALPKYSLKEGEAPCLSLSFRGGGKIYLDSFWLGPSNEYGHEYSLAAFTGRKSGSILRLPACPVGSPDLASESWLNSDNGVSVFHQENNKLLLFYQNNLALSLDFCKDLGLNPWLVIDSQASDLELKHLMQYLFGQENTAYGKLRADQGAVSRYSDVFQQIYLEILDSEDKLSNDNQRQTYVDWVIKSLIETPEYPQIKDKVIFVDGMKYKDNVVLSGGDFHASDLVLDRRINSLSDLTSFNDHLYEILPRDIDRSLDSRSELIRSTSLATSDLRLADLVASSLSLLGGKKSASLLDLDYSQMEDQGQFAACFGQLGDLIYGSNLYDLTSKIEQDRVAAFAFGRKQKRVIVLANLSEETVGCQVSNLNFEGFQEFIYDRQGKLLDQAKVKRRDHSFSLLPGSVIILTGDDNGK